MNYCTICDVVMVEKVESVITITCSTCGEGVVDLCAECAANPDNHKGWTCDCQDIPEEQDKYEHRTCATLGTNFRDVYKNDELFAMEVDKTVAEWFCSNSFLFIGSVSAPIAKLRCWIMEQEYLRGRK